MERTGNGQTPQTYGWSIGKVTPRQLRGVAFEPINEQRGSHASGTHDNHHVRGQGANRPDRTAAKQENLLGVIMPNGKPLKDCTGEYLGQIGQAMQELGFRFGMD